MVANVEAHGQTQGARALRRGIDLLRTRGVLLVLSDLYDDEDGVHTELRRAARIGHDVVVFHVLTPDEVRLVVHGATEFEDAETGQRVFAGPSAAAEHEKHMAAFVNRWRERCATYGIDYCGVRTDAPLDTMLRGYLLQRRGAPRR